MGTQNLNSKHLIKSHSKVNNNYSYGNDADFQESLNQQSELTVNHIRHNTNGEDSDDKSDVKIAFNREDTLGNQHKIIRARGGAHHHSTSHDNKLSNTNGNLPHGSGLPPMQNKQKAAAGNQDEQVKMIENFKNMFLNYSANV